MIKARVTIGRSNLDTLVLGLSRANIDRLQEGQPIRFGGAQVGLTLDQVVITFGETEADIIEDLRSIGVTLNQAQDL